MDREKLLPCHSPGIFFTVAASVSLTEMPQVPARPALRSAGCWVTVAPSRPGPCLLWPVARLPCHLDAQSEGARCRSSSPEGATPGLSL